MNQQQLEDLMVTQNPQWRDGFCWENYIAKDIKRDAFSILWENLNSNRQIIALTGPRRVGKSYLLHQLAAQLLRLKTIPSKNILYFSFNSNQDEKDLIHQLINLFKSKFSDGKESVVFLDEVQFVSYWADQIKLFYDQELPIKFVVTGSTSIFHHQKSRESLLGRINKIPIGVLSFSEYLRFKNIYSPINNRAGFISELPLLRSEFKSYLFSGQLPELVLDSNIDKTSYLTQLVDQLVNFDVPWLYKYLDRTEFTNLFKVLSAELANEVSMNKLATGLGVNRSVVTEYLRILEEIGYFSLCYNSFFKKMRAKISGIKKSYSLNTNLSLSVNGFEKSYFNDARVLGHYAENYVFMRLKNKFPLENIEYYSDRKTEVDFVTANDVWEVKYGQIGDIEKYQSVAQKLHKKLTIVTESEWEDGEVAKLPIYLL